MLDLASAIAESPRLQSIYRLRPDVRRDAGDAEGPGNVTHRQLHFFGPGIQERYPQCIAGGPTALMVTGLDGKVRRCAVDSGKPGKSVENGWADGIPAKLGVLQIGQLDVIYDAHQAAIEKSLAEYEFDSTTGNLSFKENGKVVPSILSEYDVFPLDKGKWMVPQVEMRDCTFACEEMLLLEGKSATEAKQQLADYSCQGLRRDTPDIILAIERRSGRKALTLSCDHTDAQTALIKLKAAIEKHGPWIMDHGGHDRIVDAVEFSPAGPVLTVRAPFHGSMLKIKDHRQFWHPPYREKRDNHTAANQMGTLPILTMADDTRHWTGVFLPK